MKHKINKGLLLISLLVMAGCRINNFSDYQEFREAEPLQIMYIINSSGETLSALDRESGVLYNDIQTLGQSQSSSAVPNDIYIYNNTIYILLSGQNSIESYDALSLDYKSRIYLKNGFNPLNFIPVENSEYVFISGYSTDEIVLVNLGTMNVLSDFVAVFEEVDLNGVSHNEITASPTIKNCTGDNKHRGVTGGVVDLNGAESRLYLSNVRYDPQILLTEGDSLAEFNGSNVRANGYFREGTLSIISFDEADLNSSISGNIDLTLLKEINLDSLYRSETGEKSYFSGDGLNPQTLMILENRLNIVCTGTNGGNLRYFTAGEYIPDDYSSGDPVPGTDPDDGVILVLDLSDKDNPVYFKHLSIGGSPAGFRNSIDNINERVYLAGVGAIHAYNFGSEDNDYNILNGEENPVIRAENEASDYYSSILLDSESNILYSSFYSESYLLSISVSGSDTKPLYGNPLSQRTGDGPGALALWNRDP